MKRDRGAARCLLQSNEASWATTQSNSRSAFQEPILAQWIEAISVATT